MSGGARKCACYTGCPREPRATSPFCDEDCERGECLHPPTFDCFSSDESSPFDDLPDTPPKSSAFSILPDSPPPGPSFGDLPDSPPSSPPKFQTQQTAGSPFSFTPVSVSSSQLPDSPPKRFTVSQLFPSFDLSGSTSPPKYKPITLPLSSSSSLPDSPPSSPPKQTQSFSFNSNIPSQAPSFDSLPDSPPSSPPSSGPKSISSSSTATDVPLFDSLPDSPPSSPGPVAAQPRPKSMWAAAVPKKKPCACKKGCKSSSNPPRAFCSNDCELGNCDHSSPVLKTSLPKNPTPGPAASPSPAAQIASSPAASPAPVKNATAPAKVTAPSTPASASASPVVAPKAASSPVVQANSSAAAAATCACARGCKNPANPPHTFCSRECGLNTCKHLAASGSYPATPPSPSAPKASAPTTTTVACACKKGCKNLANPPHPFCSRDCGLGSCNHAASSAAQPAQAQAAAAAAAAGPTCSCARGCKSPVNPPHNFCSRECGLNSCKHPPASGATCTCARGCSNPANPPHLFCSRECGLKSCNHPAVSTSSSSSSSSSSSMPLASSGPKCSCFNCPKPPNPGHPFCSRACGTKTCGHPPPPPLCRCTGCNTPTRPDGETPGVHYNFCGTRCATKKCGHAHRPGLINKLSITNPTKFNELKDFFLKRWLHSKASPTVLEIYTIDMSVHQHNFDSYRQMIIAKRPHLAKGTAKGGPGNSCNRFHGTDQHCGLGVMTMDCCSLPNCRVCLVLKSGGLKVNKAKSKISFARFGNGIYFTATSSKADDYSNGSRKAVFISELIVGDAEKLKQDATHLTQPPNGKDSVLGEPGGTLNYDEVVIYNDNATILKYLIHYR